MPGAKRMLLQLFVQDAWFVLDASLVQEILGRRRWVPIPDCDRATPGVLEWRGRAVAVLDVAGASGRPLDPKDSKPRTIITQVSDCTLALPVDAVREIKEIDEDALSPPRITRHPWATHEVDVDGKMMSVLDLSIVTKRLLGSKEAR
jgi:chemotaxis signal transduction protein